MAIRLAPSTHEEELAALKAEALHHIALGATRVESDTWCILGLPVSLRVVMRPHGPAARIGPHITHYVAGRRVGWNALTKLLRERAAALSTQDSQQ